MKFPGRSYLVILGMLFGLFGGIAHVSAQQKEDKIRTAVTAVNQDLMKAFADGDGTGVASFYAANGQLLPPNGKTISGREAIGRYWQGAIDSGIKTLKIEVLEVFSIKDKAATIGRFTIFDGNDRRLDAGKYIVLWIRENGKWRLHRDIWNSDGSQN